MKVKDLKEQLLDFDDEADVFYVLGKMSINLPYTGRNYRYMTVPILGICKSDNGDCLIIDDKLHST